MPTVPYILVNGVQLHVLIMMELSVGEPVKVPLLPGMEMKELVMVNSNMQWVFLYILLPENSLLPIRQQSNSGSR